MIVSDLHVASIVARLAGFRPLIDLGNLELPELPDLVRRHSLLDPVVYGVLADTQMTGYLIN